MTASEDSEENIVLPERKLRAPQNYLDSEKSDWLIVAKNKKVNAAWEALMARAPENTLRCYQVLCTAPTTRLPGRTFPLRGKKYKGCWEYEVTKGDRVFYLPSEEERKVIVYYAGAHITPAPVP